MQVAWHTMSLLIKIHILVVARVSDLYERLAKFSLYLMLQSNVWESKSDFPLLYSYYSLIPFIYRVQQSYAGSVQLHC